MTRGKGKWKNAREKQMKENFEIFDLKIWIQRDPKFDSWRKSPQISTLRQGAVKPVYNERPTNWENGVRNKEVSTADKFQWLIKIISTYLFIIHGVFAG